MSLAPTRRGEVDGRPVAVFDGLLPAEALEQMFEALNQAPFRHTEVARPETADYKHWAMEMPLENLVQLPLWPPVARAVEAMRLGRAYRPYRSYTNYAQFGDMLFTHTDCAPDAHELTALWYLMPRWDLEWGGETLFFDANEECAYAVSPKPGRLVIFDGAIRHCGRPPNRICYMPRYSFAIKLEPIGPATHAA